MSDPDSQAADRHALFPLNLVLFPGGLLALRIFEPRYQRMVSECLRAQRPFVVAAIIDGPEAGGIAETAPSGTLARIIDWEPLEDGLLGLLCEGEEVVLLGGVQVEPDNLLRVATVRRPALAPQPLPAQFRWMAELLGELLHRIGPPFDRLSLEHPGADHVSARLTELLPLPLVEKQRLFEIPDHIERLRRLAGLIDPGAGAGARPS
jgi:Lon protease-like protein